MLGIQISVGVQYTYVPAQVPLILHQVADCATLPPQQSHHSQAPIKERIFNSSSTTAWRRRRKKFAGCRAQHGIALGEPPQWKMTDTLRLCGAGGPSLLLREELGQAAILRLHLSRNCWRPAFSQAISQKTPIKAIIPKTSNGTFQDYHKILRYHALLKPFGDRI